MFFLAESTFCHDVPAIYSNSFFPRFEGNKILNQTNLQVDSQYCFIMEANRIRAN